eukprot:SAG11_NODE_8014_length_1069_cov_2.110309_3_plen_69_part_00
MGAEPAEEDADDDAVLCPSYWFTIQYLVLVVIVRLHEKVDSLCIQSVLNKIDTTRRDLITAGTSTGGT